MIIFKLMTELIGGSLENNAIFLLVGDLLEDNDFASIHELIKGFHHADVAVILNLLGDADALRILKGFDEDKQADIITELNESKQQFIVNNVKRERLSEIVEEMDSDDAADLVGLMDEEAREQFLDHVEKADAEEVRELLNHDEETAGGLMSKEVVFVRDHSTVEEAIREIRKAVEETEQVYNVFVVSSEKGELRGVLSLNILILAKPQNSISPLMVNTVSVPTYMDQEEVARIAKKYGMVEIPVVDENNVLVGRITHDDILDVVQEEAVEDIGHLAGTGDEDIQDSALETSRKRLTWLIFGLAGGILSAFIMSRFEIAISRILLLAFFVPVIMAMGGIVGIQSSTITVRGLATGEIIPGKLWKRVLRETGIAFINGSICGLLLMLIIFFWQRDWAIGFVVGGSMATVMLVSTISGTLVPIALNKLKIDPALATGPFVTTMNDIIGLVVYFTLTAIFL